MRSLLITVVVLLAGCQSPSSDEAASEARVYEDYPPGAPQDCLDASRIESIEPIGDHTLLFYVRGGDVWRNRLRSNCPGLRRDTQFLYERRGSRLCRGEIVFQLLRFGSDFDRGAGCQLGQFDYLTEDQAEALKTLR